MQGMVATQPNTDFGTTSGTAAYQSDMVRAATRTRRLQMTNPDSDEESTYNDHDRQFRQSMTPEMTDPYEHLLDAPTTLPSPIQTNNPRLLQTQVPTFRGTKNTFNEFEHLFRDHLRPVSYRLTEEAKLQYFQSHLR